MLFLSMQKQYKNKQKYIFFYSKQKEIIFSSEGRAKQNSFFQLQLNFVIKKEWFFCCYEFSPTKYKY